MRTKLFSPIIWISSIGLVHGFTFSHSSPAQCSNITLQWEGGSPPFYATVVPVYPMPGARIQNYSIPSTSGAGSQSRQTSFKLNQPSAAEIIVVMSDSTGWGSGGVTPILMVNSSSDSSCYQTPPAQPFFFYLDPPSSPSITQCSNQGISWDRSVTYPLQLLAAIPGGSAFAITIPQSSSQNSIRWPVSIRQGTDFILMMADAMGMSTGFGGSTNLTRVVGGAGSCLNSNSPGQGAGSITLLSQGSTVLSSTRSMTRSAETGISTSIGDSSSGGSSSGSGPNTGAIAGGVVGGVIVIILLIFLLLLCRRKKRRSTQTSQDENRGQSQTQAEMTQIRDPDYTPSSTSGNASGAGAAAILRRASKALPRSKTARRSANFSQSPFDILSNEVYDTQSPLSDDRIRASSLEVQRLQQTENLGIPSYSASVDNLNQEDPFVSPFPSNLRMTSTNTMSRENIARIPTPVTVTPLMASEMGHRRDKSDTSLLSHHLTNNFDDPSGSGSTGRKAGKLITGAGQLTETPPQSPVNRQSELGSMSRGTPAPRRTLSGTRWSVDDDPYFSPMGIDQVRDTNDVTRQRPAETNERRRTFLLHEDAGPGDPSEVGEPQSLYNDNRDARSNGQSVTELPPLYNQLRLRNPDGE